MVELFLTVCLLAKPVTCEHFAVPFLPPMSLLECIVRGQVHAVAWERDHPEWRIEALTCGLPES